MCEKNSGWLIAVGIGLAALVVGALDQMPAREVPSSSIRVLILDNSLERPIYRPERQWSVSLDGAPYDRIHMPTLDADVSLEPYTHVIISGSTASIVEPTEWIDAEAALVRDAARMDLAILGSCFGHQLLVYALSGPEYVRHADAPEIGWIEIFMDEVEMAGDPVFAEIPAVWHAFAWHSDEVVDPPAPWHVLGSSTGCDVHVIRFGGENIWGLQSHPETPAHTAKALLWLQRIFFGWHSEEIEDALGQPPQDDGMITSIVAGFLAVGRQP
ncbi:type 1 glutamine amidotransferase [Candidatus Bipolaricaulota bacterium]|nr:type 1 glutamine amidotransferase [Candidatus Bipolaricaulota bacterium]